MRRDFLLFLLIVAVVLVGRLAATRIGFGLGYSFTPVTPPSGVITLTAAPDGGWTWFGGPRAIYYNDNTYFGYVDTSGSVCMRVYNHTAATTGAEIQLRFSLDIDDHSQPAFLIRDSDHKMMTFYERHDPQDSAARMRISTTSLDTDPDLSDGFATEVNLDSQIGGSTYNYPNPFQFSNGDIHLFYREGNASVGRLIRTISTDDGATWGAKATIYEASYGYWKIAQDGDRLDFAVTNDSPNVSTTSLAHGYYDQAADTWHKSDGSSAGTIPHAFADFTTVYNAANTWVYDIGYVGGDPVILHPTYPVEFTSHRYHYSSWDGAAWNTETIVDAGTGIDTATHAYSGGFVLDPIDAQIVYASREVAGQFEMYRYTTADAGATWDDDAMTTGSASKNIRPAAVLNADTDLRVIWMFGTYTGYTAYNTGLKGSP